MEIEEAIRCIRALANALNPETNEPLEETSICRRPLAVKALNRALASLVAQQEREKLKPANAGRTWSQAEDAEICEELRAGTDFHEIAKKHNRSLASILARLVKLGKIAPGKGAQVLPPKVA